MKNHNDSDGTSDLQRELDAARTRLDHCDKELACLHAMSALEETPEMPYNTMYRNIARIIISSLQHPESAQVEISVGDTVFRMPARQNEGETALECCVGSVEETLGRIRVCYSDKTFLLYESRLITAVAERLDGILRRRRSEETLQRANEELERRIAEALEEIKMLRGIIPICVNCKKIRDDDGYWEEVEVYIREHAEVEFSHSICPACMKKLYPYYVPDEKQE